MTIKIIGTESLGVRGMCCLITTRDRQILIDPGIALGYQRHGLLPHPCQVARGIKIRKDILKALKTATDIVFSHFHGDHIPLLQANPYQLSFKQISDNFHGLRIWAKSQENFLPRMQRRALDLAELLGTNMKIADGAKEGPLSFSSPVPHGLAESRFGTVMMTRIDMGEQVFVHASDIQLLDDIVIDKILFWQPDILFVSGPPLYLKVMTDTLQNKAWKNGLRLAQNIDTLIVDHHLLRSEQGIIWLNNMSQVVGKKIYCAADFMNKPRLLFEARRKDLYKKMPVPGNWHQDYEEGKIPIEKVADYCNISLPGYAETKQKITFKDAAGVDEAKQELGEVIEFLRNSEHFQRLEGHMSKGVLLVCPPGMGKTLPAKAVSGEAGVSFFNISGSDFVEMFVRVGAVRVRDLFEQARAKAPCIIFILTVKTKRDEGKEKHIPHMEIAKGHRSGRDIIRVVVGHETSHPKTVERHIAWIELYGIKKDNDQVVNIGRATCAPVYSNPNMHFQINNIEDFRSFHALAYCNIHGLWANSVERKKEIQ